MWKDRKRLAMSFACMHAPPQILCEAKTECPTMDAYALRESSSRRISLKERVLGIEVAGACADKGAEIGGGIGEEIGEEIGEWTGEDIGGEIGDWTGEEIGWGVVWSRRGNTVSRQSGPYFVRHGLLLGKRILITRGSPLLARGRPHWRAVQMRSPLSDRCHFCFTCQKSFHESRIGFVDCIDCAGFWEFLFQGLDLGQDRVNSSIKSFQSRLQGCHSLLQVGLQVGRWDIHSLPRM